MPLLLLLAAPTNHQDVLARVRDASLRHCLQFGVGLHHAGLAEADRQMVERLYVTQKIQVGTTTGVKHCCSYPTRKQQLNLARYVDIKAVALTFNAFKNRG